MNTMIVQIIVDNKILLSWTKSNISFELRIVKMIGHKQMYIIPMNTMMIIWRQWFFKKSVWDEKETVYVKFDIIATKF